MGDDGDNWTTIMITKLEEQLKVLCNSLKGKKNLDNIKVIGDLSGQTKKEDLLKVTLEMYCYSKKVLSVLKNSGSTNADEMDVPSLIRNELTELLPLLLKEALNGGEARPKPPEETPQESHTIVLKKIGEGEDEEKLSEGEWTKVVQQDVKKAL